MDEKTPTALVAWTVLTDAALDSYQQLGIALPYADVFVDAESGQDPDVVVTQALSELYKEGFIFFFRMDPDREATWAARHAQLKPSEVEDLFDEGISLIPAQQDIWIAATERGEEKAARPPRWFTWPTDTLPADSTITPE